MKKSVLLLAVLSSNLVWQTSIAQNLNNQIEPASSSNSLKNGGEVPGYISSPAGVDLLKNAVTNPDGSRTIKAGQQTPEANELNRKYCESFGARDITNESDFTLGPGAVYAAACSGGRPSTATAQAIPGMGTGRIFLPVPAENLEHESINYSLQ